jgi:hypothetical protein
MPEKRVFGHAAYDYNGLTGWPVRIDPTQRWSREGSGKSSHGGWAMFN